MHTILNPGILLVYGGMTTVVYLIKDILVTVFTYVWIGINVGDQMNPTQVNNIITINLKVVGWGVSGQL